VAQSSFEHDKFSRKNRPHGVLSGARNLSVVDRYPMDNWTDRFTDAVSEFSLANRHPESTAQKSELNYGV